jgi:hypothetical protein
MKRPYPLILALLTIAAFSLAACGGGGGSSDDSPPTAPASLAASALSDTEVSLSWAASEDDRAVDAYRIYRSGGAVAETGDTAFIDTGLAASTTYCYTVTALDSSENESEPSAEVCATTEAGPVAVGWTKTFGVQGNYEEGRVVIPTSDGNYLVAGYKDREIALADLYLIKMAGDGTEIWSTTVGGDYNDEAYAAVETADGGFAVVGKTRVLGDYYDIYLVRTNSSGAVLWETTLGGADDDYAYALAEMPDGGFALAGNTFSSGAGYSDAYAVRTDASGAVIWEKTFGGADADYFYDLVANADGSVVLAGSTASSGAGQGDMYAVKVASDGTTAFEATVGGAEDDAAYALAATADGGYVLAGITYSYGAGYSDAYAVKIDSSGAVVWQQAYGGGDGDYAEDVVATADGGFALTGMTGSLGLGWTDLYLVRTDSLGALLWEKYFGGDGEEYGNSVVETTDGGFLMAGYSNSYDRVYNPAVGDWDTFSDVYVVKTDALGNLFAQ